MGKARHPGFSAGRKLMRWSNSFIPTLRDDPTEAEAPSHRLLVRAGFVRQLMTGSYSVLPLGFKVRAKIATIIRDELDAIGAQEFLLPALHPAELWRASGRWEVMGQEMFRLKDRRQADLALGMTHEEVFTQLALELASYRELPQIWYQIQTKFRDEPRPTGGVLRTREFTMKDSYSFDLDEDGQDASFEAHRTAYQRIFTRAGLAAVPVVASSGAMGGSASVEFMVRAEVGEDRIVSCPSCGYAANVQRATSTLGPIQDDAAPPVPERFPTPGVRTIDELARFDSQATPQRQIKTLAYMMDGRLVLTLLRGDHGLVEQKLADASGGGGLRPAQPDEIRAELGASPGSLGAVGVSTIPVYADLALSGRRNMVTGANQDGFHLRGVDVERDIAVTTWVDLREVQAGEACPVCGSGLEVWNGIEVGHIFKLGRKYSEALGANVLDAHGKPRALVMGSYGIGLERTMAAVVESCHDEKGILWPMSVAPYQVVVTLVRTDDPASVAAGEEIYQSLLAAGIDALIDDRPQRVGVKFADAELVGIPLRVTVGPRALAEDRVELVTRAGGTVEEIGTAQVVAEVVSRVSAAVGVRRSPEPGAGHPSL